MKIFAINLQMFDEDGIRGLYNKYLEIDGEQVLFKKDFTVTESRETFDDETDQSESFKAKGVSSADGSISGNVKLVLDTATKDPGLAAMETAFRAGTKVDVIYRNVTAAGEPEYTTKGIVTSFGGDHGDPQMIPFEIQFTQAVVKSAQA